MPVAITQSACLLSSTELTLSSGVDIRLAEAVGITMPLAKVRREAWVQVPTQVGPHGVALNAGMQWRRVYALDVDSRTGFESIDIRKLVATRLAYVAEDAAELTFAVRKAA